MSLLKLLVIIYLLPLLDFFGVHLSEDEDKFKHRFTFCSYRQGSVSRSFHAQICRFKCLVPIYVLPEMKLLLVPSVHSYICEKFIYFQDRSAYSATGKYSMQ